MKKCPHYSAKGYKVLGRQYIAHCSALKKGLLQCPKGTNNNCEIKRTVKPRTMTVKAWVYSMPNGGITELTLFDRSRWSGSWIKGKFTYALPAKGRNK